LPWGYADGLVWLQALLRPLFNALHVRRDQLLECVERARTLLERYAHGHASALPLHGGAHHVPVALMGNYTVALSRRAVRTHVYSCVARPALRWADGLCVCASVCKQSQALRSPREDEEEPASPPLFGNPYRFGNAKQKGMVDEAEEAVELQGHRAASPDRVTHAR
jgi:hypothetical protein